MNIHGLKKKIEKVKEALKVEDKKPKYEQSFKKIKSLQEKKRRIKREIREINLLRAKKKGK